MIRIISIIAVISLFSITYFYKTRTPFPDTMARPAIGKLNSVSYEPGRMVTWYSRGEGPTIALLASAGREVSDFNELVLDLNKAGYHTMAIEAPGINGASLLKNPTLDDLADTVAMAAKGAQTTPDFIIGHAFGNRVARMYASQNPDTVKAVVLLAAGGENDIDPIANKSLKNIFSPLRSTRQRLDDIEYAFFAPGNSIPEYWKKGWHTKTAIMQGKAKNTYTSMDWIRAGDRPILIVQARQDRIAPKAQTADVLATQMPEIVTVMTIENAGHALLPEQPQNISTTVITFLNTHREGSYE